MNDTLREQIVLGKVADYARSCANLEGVKPNTLALILEQIAAELRK